MQSRFFNHIVHDQVAGTVTKTSPLKSAKLADEIGWFLDLPKKWHGYIPLIQEYSLQEPVHLTMNWIPHPNVGDLFVNRMMPVERWKLFFGNLETIFRNFSEYPREISKDHLEKMYIAKTMQRLSSFILHNDWARKIRQRGFYRLNGVQVMCPLYIFHKHLSDFRKLLERPLAGIIHGDLCFSNLFYDLAEDNVYMIDPRGRFGSKGIYGDQRYDLAKVRHSLSGYEHIVRDAFTIHVTDESIDIHITLHNEHETLRKLWDQSLAEGLHEVKMIEALLYLSMLPYHREHPDRQLAMYAVATRLLYEALD
ncbi:hypothetical protein [Paenibacillus sp. SYP-B4298]|uniref:hypothetical protein n=1 Tax=Paenibacillus sp. SYP-B4298 TaxID=2996034 RepID=UPI0022DD3780|nr:hypothetical protein [Paenibacillus sp. SYP-B4298]